AETELARAAIGNVLQRAHRRAGRRRERARAPGVVVSVRGCGHRKARVLRAAALALVDSRAGARKRTELTTRGTGCQFRAPRRSAARHAGRRRARGARPAVRRPALAEAGERSLGRRSLRVGGKKPRKLTVARSSAETCRPFGAIRDRK